MNSWILLTAVLMTAQAQIVVQPPPCWNQSIEYYRATDGSTIVTCGNIPIEDFCIPAELSDVDSLILDLTDCSTYSSDSIPSGLFQRNSLIRRLRVYAPQSTNHAIQSLKGETFDNLQELLELSLEGFQRVRDLDPDVFRPLVSLKKLRLIEFGGQFLTYSKLGDALFGLSNSSLEELTMDYIHTIANQEKVLDLNSLFRIYGVNITSLVLTNNDFNAVTGRLSNVLPSLRYFECSMYWLTFAAMNFGIDSLVFMENIEEINYSFLGYSRTRRSLTRRSSDDVFGVFDSKTMKYFEGLEPSQNCLYGRVLRVSTRLKRLTVRNMDFFHALPDDDICFDESTEVELLDFRKSPMRTIPGSITGVRKLRIFNLQSTKMTNISVSLFNEMPNLEILLLGGNNIASSVAADIDGNLFRFQNRSLRSLDLSICGITTIPQTMFSNLSALQFLNLSRNIIETFQVKFHPSANLSQLNLNDNSIRMLSTEMTDELESLQSTDENRTKLTIDLSRNPLSCLCNATDFVFWLKSTNSISFENFNEYTCQHPNESRVSVDRLNITELVSNCQSLSQLPTTCPCEGLNYNRLRQMVLSLSDVYCTYDSKKLSYADLVANTNKTLEEYWWCRPAKESPFYTSPRFIVPVIVGFLLIVLLGIALIVIYKKRYTPSEVARMMQCMNLQPYIIHFIRYLSNRPAFTSYNHEFDVFVYCQDDDRHWVNEVLLERLQHLKVITPDDLSLGEFEVDVTLDGCQKSRVVVLVLSLSFRFDDLCRGVTLRSYTSHPGSVIPVVINNTDLSHFDDDPLFSNLIATHNPIDLSSEDPIVWMEFISRVDNINQVLAPKKSLFCCFGLHACPFQICQRIRTYTSRRLCIVQERNILV